MPSLLDIKPLFGKLFPQATSSILDRFWKTYPYAKSRQTVPILTVGSILRSIYLKVETVNVCNNLCIICAYRDQERPKATMRMDIFQKVLTDYSEMGGGYMSFTPLVGDVLLDKHLIERLKLLDEYPAIREIGVTTNAVMANRYNDADLSYIVNRFDKISISLYGTDADEYEKMTQRQTYPQMLEGIRRIMTLRKKPVYLGFRLLKKKTKPQLIEWLKSEIFANENWDEIAQRFEINSVMTQYANWGIYNGDNTPLPYDATWFEGNKEEHREQCMIPLLAFQVFSNGDLSFCHCDNFNNVEELNVGNIENQKLIDIYNSEKVAKLWDWKTHGTPEFCKDCTFRIPMSTLKEHPDYITNPHQIVGSG